MQLKPGVRVRGMRAELAVAMLVANSVCDEMGIACTVTSCTEGKHSATSLHYAGAAFDLRTRHLSEVQARQLRDTLAAGLGTADFDVVLEARHIHVEYQPKGEA